MIEAQCWGWKIWYCRSYFGKTVSYCRNYDGKSLVLQILWWTEKNFKLNVEGEKWNWNSTLKVERLAQLLRLSAKTVIYRFVEIELKKRAAFGQAARRVLALQLDHFRKYLRNNWTNHLRKRVKLNLTLIFQWGGHQCKCWGWSSCSGSCRVFRSHLWCQTFR